MTEEGPYFVIVCATLAEARSQCAWLGLPAERTMAITAPRHIEERLYGRAVDVEMIYVTLSAPPDLMRHVNLLIHYLGLPTKKIH